MIEFGVPEGVIDLDQRPAYPSAGLIDLDRPPPPPGSVPRRDRLRLLAALLLFAAVLVAGGPDGARAGRLVPLAEVPMPFNAVSLVDGDSVFVAGSGPAGNAVASYRLGDDVPRWTASIGTNALLGNVVTVGDTLVVTSIDAGGPRTIAFDRATGGQRWASADSVASFLPDAHRVLLVHRDPGGPLRLRGVDPSTGAVRWIYRGVGDCQYVVPYQAVGVTPVLDVLCATADGALRLDRVDPFDGIVLASGTARLADPAAAGTPVPVLTLAGGRLLLTYPAHLATNTPHPPQARVEAYDPYLLTLQWAYLTDGNATMVNDCESLVCVTDRTGTAALDPRTGLVRWRDAPLTTAAAGRLIWTVQPAGPVTFLSLSTGQPVFSLPQGWQILFATGTGPGWLSHWDVHTGRTWFALLDPAVAELAAGPAATAPAAGPDRDPGLLMLGSVPDVYHGTCQAKGAYLTCGTVAHTLRIWRYQGPA